MSTHTAIEWTDSSWNPIRGCSRVSEGCRYCYAEGFAYRFSGAGQPYEGLVQIDSAISVENAKRLPKWNGKIRFVEEHLLDPLKWGPVIIHDEVCDGRAKCSCGKPYSGWGSTRSRRIFVNSMSDLFHENAPDAMRDRIFAVMVLCPQHTFQVLTKRPERMLAYLTDRETWPRIVSEMEILHAAGKVRADALKRALVTGMPLPHVQLGVSVEDQPAADKRIPLLLQTPAAVRFLSCEPLLGLLDIEQYLDTAFVVVDGAADYTVPAVDWVIVGGESGPHARPMHPAWVRSLRDQCVAAGVPFFFKQWGEYKCEPVDPPRSVEHLSCIDQLGRECALSRKDGDEWWNLAGDAQSWKRGPLPDGLVEKLRPGKKAAGHLLDGLEWHQFPEARR